MYIVSYAQNFEDVMLWRAFSSAISGFYIDVGAQDPIVDSVSLSFYEKGWRGLHVEPSPNYANKLRERRPDEEVVEAALGAEAGKQTFFDIQETGLSTLVESIAIEHCKIGRDIKAREVQVYTLDSIFERVRGRDVHWLKIDVEGFESQVLKGWRDSQVRPWIVLIESTKPTCQEPSSEDWEDLILAKGYKFAYFDGLNRFYVSEQHQDLLKHFTSPPNVFDGFMLGGQASHPFHSFIVEKGRREIFQVNEELARQVSANLEIEQKCKDLRGKKVSLESRICSLESELSKQEQLLKTKEEELARQKELTNEIFIALDAVYKSRSWKLTKVLRSIRSSVKSGLQWRQVDMIRKMIAFAVRPFYRAVMRSPTIKNFTKTFLSKAGLLPVVKKTFFALKSSTRPQSKQGNTVTQVLSAPSDLSNEAKIIYSRLVYSVDAHKERS